MSLTEFNNILVGKFRRITSSSLFIPEIDGLRFLAISMVVMYHLSGEVVLRNKFVFTSTAFFYNLIYKFFDNGFKGVLLFFTISGFILALPFAKHFISKEKAVSIKSYFLRRLTRIEPPYVISIIVCFFYLVFKGTHTFSTLWLSLTSALLYLNNNFQLGTVVNGVTWSLEIEVQFYIIAPLICYIFVLNKIVRRVLLLSLIILLPFINIFYFPRVSTLYNFIQYFFVGILLTDLYISNFKITLSKSFSVIAGILIFIIMMYIDISAAVGQIIFLFSIMFFYFLVLTSDFWKKIFSIKYITVIGGMCYSIYLWHYLIIDAVIKGTIFIKKPNDYLVTFALQCLLILPCILILSSLFYLLVERPCMDKNWPIKLMNFFKKNFKMVK